MTDSEIKKVFSELSYKEDKRKPPDNLRRGQFHRGWNRRKPITEKTLNSRLTWNNLGYRMGQYFDSPQSKEQIDKVFQVLVADYRSGVTPSAKKVVSKATKTDVTRRRRNTGQTSKNKPQRNDFPDEIDENVSLPEGAKQRVTVNKYERNPQLRKQCIARYGTKCCICGFSFEDTYGEVAEGFIHVHHVKPLSEIGTRHDVDPVEDLRPVCPNCHAVIHIRKGKLAFRIKEVEALLHRESR